MRASTHGGRCAIPMPLAGGNQNPVISFASQSIAQDPMEVVKQISRMPKSHAKGHSRPAHCRKLGLVGISTIANCEGNTTVGFENSLAHDEPYT